MEVTVEITAPEGDYVETWKAIAAEMKRSERWCRYMSLRPVDPLPIVHVGSYARLYLADAAAWSARQTKKGHRLALAWCRTSVGEVARYGHAFQWLLKVSDAG